MDIKDLNYDFQKVFNTAIEGLKFFAPGRVNLIGEHTDYNGGHVFPCALSLGTYAIASKSSSSKIRLYSKNFEDTGIIEAEVDGISYDKAWDWANYPLGIAKMLVDAGFSIDTGFDIMFYGNIPNGAGLSSSASIELVTCVALKTLFQLDIDMIEMVKLSQRSENQFNGVNCGIMDQFASGMCKKDHALLLNTNSLSYKHVPMELGEISIVIANTNKRRGLAASKYNERRTECTRALEALQRVLDIQYLGDLTEDQFEDHCYLIENTIDRKRAKHAVYENQRAIKAVEALMVGNIRVFGQLMNESHNSLKDDYEVSAIELDTLVNAAWDNGAIGSRMTGAGFGGCTVSLVSNSDIKNFIANVAREYEAKIGYKADFYIVATGDGARQI
ncbi:MAG: galactokinase [Clostridia bacterium]|jgi:galactokinase|nr:galactokinase [Clostridia bacterium]